MKKQLIFSLDIGSSKIVSLVGLIGEEIEVQAVSHFYFTNTSNSNHFQNIKNGVIYNLDFVTHKVQQTLAEARIDADCSMGDVITNISGSKVSSLYSSQTTSLLGQNITPSVIQSLTEKTILKNFNQSLELLDYETQEYCIDNEHYINNPINLVANTIESNMNLFLASKLQINNIKKIGYNISKIIPSSILSAMATLNHEEKELGCCLLDIGAGTTDLVVYENNFIRSVISIPLGGENITQDIAQVLKISRNLAEDIKLNYGLYSNANYNITITDHRGMDINISYRLLTDVIYERLKEIFSLVKTFLKKENMYDIINSGIVITGGVSLTPKIDITAKQFFDIPVRIGIPFYSGNFAEIIATPKYATGLGVLYFVKTYMLDENLNKKSAKTIIQRIKKLFTR